MSMRSFIEGIVNRSSVVGNSIADALNTLYANFISVQGNTTTIVGDYTVNTVAKKIVLINSVEDTDVLISTVTINNIYMEVFIKDNILNAESYVFRILTEGSQTIDGADYAQFTANGESILLGSDGSNIYVVR